MIDITTYFNDTKQRLKDLLEERKNSTNRDESSVQKFFEDFPFVLLSSLTDGSQYNIFGSLIVSQPRLKSFNGDRQPDFLIVSQDSLNFYFNFIEIEDPAKKIFDTTNQKPSTDFFHSYNQLIQWRSFKNEVADYCDELLRSLFFENFNNRPEKLKHYNHILLYGFSDEVIKLGERHNHLIQNYFTEKDLQHCTFSRLIDNLRLERPFFSVKKDATTNKFKAIGFAPFTKYKLDQWSDFHNIIEKQELVNSSEFLNDTEKAELINQINNLDSKPLKEIIEINLADMGTDIFDSEAFEI